MVRKLGKHEGNKAGKVYESDETTITNTNVELTSRNNGRKERKEENGGE